MEPLTIIVMILWLLAAASPRGVPRRGFPGTYLSTFVLWLHNTPLVGVAAFAAVMLFVIMTGMDGALFLPDADAGTVDPCTSPSFFPALTVLHIDQGITLAVASKPQRTTPT